MSPCSFFSVDDVRIGSGRFWFSPTADQEQQTSGKLKRAKQKKATNQFQSFFDIAPFSFKYNAQLTR
jgi:hypothetical protein